MFGSRVYPLPARTSRRLGGSPVGGHGDVFSGGSPWTVTGPLFDLFDLPVLSCSLVMLTVDFNVFRRRQPTKTGLTGMVTCWIYNTGTNTSLVLSD